MMAVFLVSSDIDRTVKEELQSLIKGLFIISANPKHRFVTCGIMFIPCNIYSIPGRTCHHLLTHAELLITLSPRHSP